MIIWETIAKNPNKMTFMRQDPDWTLQDNFLNMEVYYKDHLHLIKNGNIKFSKLIIETLQDVLSPQSSQSSSSYFWQSSLIISPFPSSVPSNLLSVQTLLSAAATPFNPKHQIIVLNSPTAPPKLQTLTLSPPFRQDLSSSLKTTSGHMHSAIVCIFFNW